MKNLFLNPLLSPVYILLFLVFIFFLGELSGIPSLHYYKNLALLETGTYYLYAISFCVIVYYFKDFYKTKMQKDYLLFVFLFLCALLREAGVQHWLTQTDTTAFKLRFFTNPNNPLSEKIISAFILITVAVVGIYLFFKYIRRIFKGFFALNPMYWTIASLGGIGIVAKIADRFPSNYSKFTGEYLTPDIDKLFYLVEEGGEATLPVLFAIAVIQYHLLLKEKGK
ncbi:MAG: hypothetical protein LBU87_06395 [Lactobacillales bacterium]|jgi:hypothetical protein|nr:hypothetical protein [Lactobacillales bacterium]